MKTIKTINALLVLLCTTLTLGSCTESTQNNANKAKQYSVKSFVKEANAQCPVVVGTLGILQKLTIDGKFVCFYFTTNTTHHQLIDKTDSVNHILLAEAQEYDDNKLFTKVANIGYGVKLYYTCGCDTTKQIVSAERLSAAFAMDKTQRQQLLLNTLIDIDKSALDSIPLPEDIKSITLEVIGDYVVYNCDWDISDDATQDEIDAMFDEMQSDRQRVIKETFTDDVVLSLRRYSMCGKGVCYRYRNPRNHKQFVDVPISKQGIDKRFERKINRIKSR